MSGVLFAVGVGPGDPNLLTLKAVKILEKAEVIAPAFSLFNHNLFAVLDVNAPFQRRVKSEE